MTQNLLNISCEFEHPKSTSIIGQPIKGLFRVTPNRDLKYVSIRYYVLLRLVSFGGKIKEERVVYHHKFQTNGVGAWNKVSPDEISPYAYSFQFTLQEAVSYTTRDFRLEWYLKFDVDYISISGKALEKAINRGLDVESLDFPKSSLECEFPFTLERGNRHLSAVHQKIDFKAPNNGLWYWSLVGLGGLGLLWARLSHHSSVIFDLIGTFGLGLGLYHMLEGAGSLGDITVALSANPTHHHLTDVKVTFEKSWSKAKKIGVRFEVFEQVRSPNNYNTVVSLHTRHLPNVEIQKKVTGNATTLQIELAPNTLPTSMTWGDYVVIWRMHVAVYLKNGTQKTYSFDFDTKL